MLKVYKHTFNPFSENTYVLADDTKECAIIDPGCSNEKERNQLIQTIEANGLKPVMLLNTHCHIDHFPGNKFICAKYNLLPQFHELEYDVMKGALAYQGFFGFFIEESPKPVTYLNGGDKVSFGNTTLDVLFTPGHSPGSVSFYNKEANVVIGGDVLFQGSVGRYDLPGANGKVLYKTVTEVMMALPDETTVYSGHGPETTIGIERNTNPFLNKDFFFGV